MVNNLDMLKLEQFAREIDIHLKKLTEFTEALRGVKDAMLKIAQSQEQSYMIELKTMRQYIEVMHEQMERMGLPKVDVYERKIKFIKEKLDSDKWPLAIDSNLISSTEESEAAKASNILDLIVTEYIEGTKFLDFGCGKGYVTQTAANRKATLSVGYDIESNWAFSNNNRLLLTTDWDTVRSKGPYDVALMFDVLDHMKGDPIYQLKQLRDVMAPHGKVFIRNHPWCSRHGAHLHTQTNKAFLHLILDELELARIGGYSVEHINKIIHPVQTYREWIHRAGFEIKNEVIIPQDVDSFFLEPENLILFESIKKHWGNENPIKDMEIVFVDYVLEIPANLNQQIF